MVALARRAFRAAAIMGLVAAMLGLTLVTPVGAAGLAWRGPAGGDMAGDHAMACHPACALLCQASLSKPSPFIRLLASARLEQRSPSGTSPPQAQSIFHPPRLHVVSQA